MQSRAFERWKKRKARGPLAVGFFARCACWVPVFSVRDEPLCAKVYSA